MARGQGLGKVGAVIALGWVNTSDANSTGQTGTVLLAPATIATTENQQVYY